MIDPPWRWRNWSPHHNWRSPESKYETMQIEEVAALPVARLLKPGGLAWVWGTWTMLAQGELTDIIRAWGLDGVTGGAWAKRTINGKLRPGTGFILRSVCEPFIIARKGPPAGHRGRSLVNLIESQVAAVSLDGLARQHSRKPEEAYRAMRTLMGPRAVLADVFSTRTQGLDGWVCWGDSVGKYDDERPTEPMEIKREGQARKIRARAAQ